MAKITPQADIVSIADLTSDANNCRKHNPRNVGGIVTSLQRVGAARSIVIDENNVVLAGNATVEAAAQAGITKLAVVEADGNTVVAVRRTGLSDKQKAELAIADNRTAELATWDAEQILAMLGVYDIDPLDVGFVQLEIDTLADIQDGTPDAGAEPEADYQETFSVIVACTGEAHQAEVYERLTGLGLTCKVLVN